MKFHAFTELAFSNGSIEEIYNFDGNFENLKEFIEGSQYDFKESIKKTVVLSNKNNGLTVNVWPGTNLVKSFDKRNVIFIYNYSTFGGYSRHLLRAPLKEDDKLYGFDVRGWTSDYNRVLTKDGEFKSVSRQELGEEEVWKHRYDLVILNKTAWTKFKETHHIELNDEKWKPHKSIAEY